MSTQIQPSQTIKFGSDEYYKAVKSITVLKPLNQNKSQDLPLKNVDKVDSLKFTSRRTLSPELDLPALPDSGVATGLYCSYCEELFANTAQQRKHYKQDWHRYNLKLRLASRAPITEEKFDQFADDVSSISGSDNDAEDDAETLGFQLHRQARILFENNKGHVISLYKCLLFDKKEQQPTDSEIVKLAQSVTFDPSCTIIMLSGGHFAAAIFKGNEPILHKTFHCYTVRAKQGGAQSTKDNKGNHPKSAGASLRRYNETALVQHVQELLSAWAPDIEKCSLIMYRAIGPTNRNVLFGGKDPPINKADVRLRNIPFPTRRPTFSQLKFVYSQLQCVHIYNSVSMLETVIEPKPRSREFVNIKKSNIDRSKSRPPLERQLPNVVQQLANLETPSGSDSEIINLICEVREVNFHEELKEFDNSFENEISKSKKKCKKKKKKQTSDEPKHLALISKKLLDAVSGIEDEALKELLNELKDVCIAEEEFSQVLNKSFDSNKYTLLHLAAKNAQKNNIRLLMLSNSSPCNKDFMSRTAYDLAPDRDTRNIFRRYMAENPDQFDYTRSHIPSPLTDEKEQETAEKKKIQKKIKKEKDKEKQKVKDIIKKEQNEKELFLKLSDREKMAIAAEKRMLAAAKVSPVLVRCFQCASDITGKVPFMYNDYRFCTMPCLKIHRQKYPTLEI